MPYYVPSGQPPQTSPADIIRALRGQGMDNNQIIQALQRQGFSSDAIFDAMNQVEMAPDAQAGSQDPRMQGQDQFQYPPYPQAPQRGAARPVPLPQEGTTDEELIEAIIEEKWNDLVKDLDKVIEWKNSANNRIAAMEQKIEDMRREFDKLHSAIITKIDDYDKNIMTVGAEVKAMEKVFSKVLPVFAENVSELSRITHDLKKPPVKTK
jgi:DNA-binding transcriptional MerR regulator